MGRHSAPTEVPIETPVSPAAALAPPPVVLVPTYADAPPPPAYQPPLSQPPAAYQPLGGYQATGPVTGPVPGYLPPPTVYRPPARRSRALLLVPLLALAGLVGGGAFAADKVVKNDVCDSVRAPLAALIAAPTAADVATSAGRLRTALTATRTESKVLFFDGGVKTSAAALTTDLGQFGAVGADFEAIQAGAKPSARLMRLLTSADTHVRDFQRSCGQTVTGFGPN